ncbi:rhomboid family intramembrane serine protease [Ferrimonas lipolytica]|uniref:Rhomboid family intramembrane serine protease n=1 Tax=Ferrimonas lipolytica TaxID=2724191 RepID=A0A6H1UFW1_9GAMM|nr:rhomboid family intramembrane serine protease [Ferrimonas lipolytica]QIZ77971.1 rhomboid family intramembrane serine protease [Ferrimonas lipolytica]
MKRISDALAPLKQSIKLSLGFAGLLWAIWLFEVLSGYSLHQYGIYPREWFGVWGILAAPFIHGSAAHLAANSTGIVILGAALLYGYPKSRWKVLLTIYLIAGCGVWLVGRSSYHFGASGITYGLFFYLLVVSLIRLDLRSIGLMMLAFFMFGSMVYGILPRDPSISFESHLFGAAGGVLAALWFGRDDPVPRRKRYQWEQEDDDPTEGLWQQEPEQLESREQYRQSQREHLR